MKNGRCFQKFEKGTEKGRFGNSKKGRLNALGIHFKRGEDLPD